VGNWEVMTADFVSAFLTGTNHGIRLTLPGGPGNEVVTDTSGTFIDNVQLNAIPEPASLTLATFASLALVFVRRRRR